MKKSEFKCQNDLWWYKPPVRRKMKANAHKRLRRKTSSMLSQNIKYKELERFEPVILATR
jgi:hypothetical protein